MANCGNLTQKPVEYCAEKCALAVRAAQAPRAVVVSAKGRVTTEARPDVMCPDFVGVYGGRFDEVYPLIKADLLEVIRTRHFAPVTRVK